jgi:hypothetical protein
MDVGGGRGTAAAAARPTTTVLDLVVANVKGVVTHLANHARPPFGVQQVGGLCAGLLGGDGGCGLSVGESGRRVEGSYYWGLLLFAFFFLQTTFTDRPIIYSHDHINTTPTISRYQLFPTPFVKLHHHYYQSLLAVGGLSSLVVALAMKEPMTHLIFGLLVSFSDKVKKDDLATCRLISFLFSLS